MTRPANARWALAMRGGWVDLEQLREVLPPMAAPGCGQPGCYHLAVWVDPHGACWCGGHGVDNGAPKPPPPDPEIPF